MHPQIQGIEDEAVFQDAKREDYWKQSIATGSRSFVEAFKGRMRSFAIGRRVRKKDEGFKLWQFQSPYKAF